MKLDDTDTTLLLTWALKTVLHLRLGRDLRFNDKIKIMFFYCTDSKQYRLCFYKLLYKGPSLP
jgi:hypothetical protein